MLEEDALAKAENHLVSRNNIGANFEHQIVLSMEDHVDPHYQAQGKTKQQSFAPEIGNHQVPMQNAIHRRDQAQEVLLLNAEHRLVPHKRDVDGGASETLFLGTDSKILPFPPLVERRSFIDQGHPFRPENHLLPLIDEVGDTAEELLFLDTENRLVRRRKPEGDPMHQTHVLDINSHLIQRRSVIPHDEAGDKIKQPESGLDKNNHIVPLRDFIRRDILENILIPNTFNSLIPVREGIHRFNEAEGVLFLDSKNRLVVSGRRIIHREQAEKSHSPDSCDSYLMPPGNKLAIKESDVEQGTYS